MSDLSQRLATARRRHRGWSLPPPVPAAWQMGRRGGRHEREDLG